MKLFKKLTVSILLVLFSVLCTAILFGCSSEVSYDDQVRITFNPEGGSYQNCTLPFVCYYDFKRDTENLIMNPESVSGIKLERSGYVLDGWYQTKALDGDKTIYSDKWDFEADKVGNEGVTLFACWKKAIKYTYNVCFTDDANEKKIIGSYDVEQGEKFDDYYHYAQKRIGYTALNFVDQSGNAWDEKFIHPGGDEDFAVDVYVNYIKGSFSLVGSAKELKKAKNGNIYLTADIDMGGEAFSFADYSYTLLGNGYSISNFNLICGSARDGGASREDIVEDLYDNSLKCWNIGLFDSLSDATIENVSFSDIRITVKATLKTINKIYLAPFSTAVSDTSVKNVSFSADYFVENLPEGFEKDEALVVANQSLCIKTDEESIFDGITVDINEVFEKFN